MEDLSKPNQQSILKADLNTSLHYPFTKNQDNIVGDVETVLARIQLVRSGKPHVTGTIPPKLDVRPEGEEQVEMPPKVLEPPRTISKSIEVTSEKSAEMDKEEYRKKRRMRRLARKAKREGKKEVLQPEEITREKAFKHNWQKKNLVTNADMSDTYECTKCKQKYKRRGFEWNAPEFGCTKE